ncbi:MULTISPECIES: metal ABC transporter substrate-binding protein [unclassified Sedimentibacter]|uniref:metal ABC transporter substrate-binding protein n=1 Tax=unclassified Sedimentibacter TaxID=2649220 RepID=UPI0027DEC20C|nr:metal ABC transporter substrate-binding protein [Sedimentibacter sp. MB35-C1]WMJ78031.1 metal ABC transporter substrate-binding protein [Sedimentibacter sp. MB35-C1]
MKKFCSLLLIGILILSLFTGCSGTQELTDSDDDGKLLVYASFYPMYDFASKIGGDKIKAVNMVPDGTEPHNWEPTPSDIVGLEKASVFIYNGAGMEHWVGDILESIQNDKLLVVEASEGLTLLEDHSHDEHSENEDENHEDEEHDHGEFDPHVWLDPMNAKAEMEKIKDAFILADPDNSDYYEANYTKYAAEIEELDKEFSDTLSPLENKDIIVTHQAFGYLCHAYGLNQVPVEGMAPDSEPDPARVAEIIEFAKEHQVNVIFFEELVNPKVAEVIADSIGAETDVLSPLEALSDEQREAGYDYFAVMRQNLESLKSALE